ncbi:DMT family transporter [Paenibacillus tarimensis]|uniref:DMT family transporter n=1 Tax=Paenibacillus tarimensis TaxID=416012 RepID=UPI001F2764A3|nr:DMT family transporter [Paenibacillus tarimensis]MCF2943801.1 DMT family transporter [Paenibacillus tarimensis]
MWILTAAGSAILFGFAGLGMKLSQTMRGSMNQLLLGLYLSGTLGFALHMAVTGGPVFSDDWRFWAASLIIGAGSAWGNLVFMKALEYGPASLTAPLTNMNIAVVVLFSTFYYREPLGPGELCGIILLLAAVVLLSVRRREKLTLSDKRWFFYVAAGIVLFTLRNGGLKVTEEMGLNSTPILLVGYALSALWFLPYVIREHRAVPEAAAAQNLRTGRRWTGMYWGLASGIFSYAGLQLYANALATGKANIAAPIFATNSLVVALGAIVLLRERLTALQTAALCFTMAGILLIRIFQS